MAQVGQLGGANSLSADSSIYALHCDVYGKVYAGGDFKNVKNGKRYESQGMAVQHLMIQFIEQLQVVEVIFSTANF